MPHTTKNDAIEIGPDLPEAKPVGDPRRIDPAMRGDAAAKSILLGLLEIMEDKEAGVLLNEDPECLHDFRIALRRTRSALGQIKGVFPERTIRVFAPRFAWLGRITGAPRDFDVCLLGFDELKAGLPQPFRDDIEAVRGFLEKQADLAHSELARQIHSPRYRTLLADWKRHLSAPCPKRPRSLHALTPIKDIADLRIRKLFRRAVGEGRSIAADTPAENIHELRKTCKKLRYLLEFFREFYPVDEIARPIKQLKKLQDYLGNFQDVHARIAMLQLIGREMRQDASVPAEVLLAMGALLAELVRRQETLRAEFADRFEPFAQAGNRARYRKLFRHKDSTD